MANELPLKQSCTIIWAQRKNLLYLTAEIEDLNIEELKCEGNQFTLKGANSLNRYSIQLDLYADLKWDDYKRIESSRHIELVIQKTKEEWWPRLLKSSSKVQWIKVDFDKWIDPELADEEAESVNNPFESYLNGNTLPTKFDFPGASMDKIESSSDESDVEMEDKTNDVHEA